MSVLHVTIAGGGLTITNVGAGKIFTTTVSGSDAIEYEVPSGDLFYELHNFGASSGYQTKYSGTVVSWNNQAGTPIFEINKSGGVVVAEGGLSSDGAAFTSDGSGDVTAVSFTGSGAGLTSLAPSALSGSGTIPQAALTPDV